MDQHELRFTARHTVHAILASLAKNTLTPAEAEDLLSMLCEEEYQRGQTMAFDDYVRTRKLG